MRKYLAEAAGTFVMVFAGCGAVVIDHATGGEVTHVGVALTFGLAVMALIYAFGDISGAHFNPAVSIGFCAAGKLSPGRLGAYVVSQCLGAAAASAALLALFGNQAALGATLPRGSELQSFGLEVILTAILMAVILNVAAGAKETGIMAGLAVGGVIGLEALFAGPISGASMNPARSLAPALLSGTCRSLWVYLAAPPIGSIIAVGLWMFLRQKKGCQTPAHLPGA